ncbi:DUF4233 domain-containing protein [Nigerium sp.]|uniref:DUF4233 domain-containing protein n=1 Tax=Nigerium sp. TaxID=2042655 RepID=UPI0032219C59
MTLRPGNPMTRVLATVLVFEAVVFALAIAGMVQVSAVPTGTAAALGGGAALLALVAAATLRRGAVGFALGWLAQASGVALGAATSWMYVMGGVFALLWVATFVLGRRLDAR